MLKPNTVAVTALLIAGCTLSALAGTLSKSQLPASAKWVMHVDIERLAASQSCAILTANPAVAKPFNAQLARYRALLGVDPLKDLRHVTLYGEDTTGNRGVALIAGNLRPDTIARTLSTYPQYRTLPCGSWTLHKWRDAASGAELNACLYSSRLLVIASDESGALGALNVLSGAKPNLARGKGRLNVPPARDGIFFTAATQGYAGSPQDPLKAMVLRSTESATVQIGEKSGQVDAGMWLNAVSPDAAGDIEKVLNGLIVATRLSGDADGLGQLAELSDVSRNDRTVAVRLSCPASQAAVLLANALFNGSH